MLFQLLIKYFVENIKSVINRKLGGKSLGKLNNKMEMTRKRTLGKLSKYLIFV